MDKKKKRFFHVAITMAFIALGAVGMIVLTASKSQLKKQNLTTLPPMVQTIKVKAREQSIIIRGEGTVRPLQEITLVPQVDGKAVYISSSLVNGGEFSKGDTLLRIEPADYQLAVTLAKAKVKNAESKLKIAEEEAAEAREEWRLLYSDRSTAHREPPLLVAKEPQLKAAQARLEADRAGLKKAMLNLERTELKAPFDGRISQENVDIGQYVSPGKVLATLFSTEAVEIVVPLENDDSFWFHVPGFTPGDGPGSSVVVHARVAGRDLTWSGEVVRIEGKLDERTRMINVVVRVKNPYARKPPLAVGLYVTVDIKGHTLPNAAIIPRNALHQGDVVWVVEKDGRLHFRKVDVARVQGDEVMVKDSLRDEEMVVTTRLKVVTDGMAVRTAPEKEAIP